MRRELLLIRHAHALPAVGLQDDFDRALSPAGQSQAQADGRWLRTNVAAPDAVLCSPARRTRETWLGLSRAFDAPLPDARLEPPIYEAGFGTLLGLIEAAFDADPALARLWLVGHNPGLEQLLAHVDAATFPVQRGLAPAAIAVLGFEADAPIAEAGRARLIAFHAP